MWKMSDDMEKLFKRTGSKRMIRDIITNSIKGKKDNEALES